MNRLALFAVAVIAVLGGCATAPTETTRTPVENESFEVSMVGNSSTTFVVTARLVADPFENLTVTYANGSTGVVAAPDQNGADMHGPEVGVLTVEPNGEIVGGTTFEGTPNFSATANELPPTRNAVYTVRARGNDTLVAWGVVRCSRHVASISMTAEGPQTVGFAFGCE